MLRGTLRKCAAVGVVVVLAAAGAHPVPASKPRPHKGARFATFGLASTPPTRAGTVCPRSTACWNQALEPQIRADRAGTFYVSTENGLFEGTIAARSRDGGRRYASLPSPNALSRTLVPGFAPGGGDTDLAVAPVKNRRGFYNVYVASLTLANVDVSTSTNGGATWRLNPAAARIAGDDREWIAADGRSKVCISYHDLATFNVNVDCSFDAGASFEHAVPGAIDAAHLFLLQNNQIGNLAIDPRRHILYQPIVGIANVGETVCGLLNLCKYHAIWMAVSVDGGRTFTDYPVYVGPSPQVMYAHQFPSVAVDRAGNVYVVFSDDRTVYYSVSTDHGRSWSPPAAISRSPATTAIFPWVAAGDAGKLDVVYYGTSYADGGPPDRYPRSAAWFVYFAQNLNATKRGSRFTQVRATPVVHYGGVCEGGISCTGNRDLFDDFGVAASPKTGRASIVYTSDQFIGTHRHPPSPRCSPQRTNTLRCDHSAIATQVSGPRIYRRHRR